MLFQNTRAHNVYSLYKYLIENNILYSRQFGFQNGHSTDDVVVQLLDQILESLENNKCTLGVLIDLSKAFDTVDYSILLKKLKLYGIKDRSYIPLLLPKLIINNYEIKRTEFIKILGVLLDEYMERTH